MISELNPGLILILGAFFVPLLPRCLRSIYMLAIPIIALVYLSYLPVGEFGRIPLFDMELVTLRVDRLSLVFGYVFLIAAVIGIIYSWHVRDWAQHVSGMVYAGSAVGAAFAGDLVTLFVFWELTAIASVFLIWASRTVASYRSGHRYLIIQIGSGVILLSGILIYFRDTGSISFNSIGIEMFAGQLILLAFGIKCAFPLLNNWLQDSYPHATVTGTVLLSAYTTKLAVYALARGYAGTDILIPVGVVMAVFPIFFAIIENDMRRLLAHALNNQLGFMVVGVGIGTELAINGVAAHAFCHIIYKALLFMAVGAVLFRVGTAKASELGGLRDVMPWTFAFCMVGAASISLPFFSSFVAKSLILSAALKGEYFWPWILMLTASAGAFFVCGLRLPYAVFGGERAKDLKFLHKVPTNMYVAMSLAAVLCISIGVYYTPLYKIMPYSVKYDPYTLDHIVVQLQLVAFSTLAFMLMIKLKMLPVLKKSTIIDGDWVYRKFGYHLAQTLALMAQVSWISGARGLTKAVVKLERLVNTYHSSDSVLGRTWPSGSIASCAVIILCCYLVLFYLA
ncbi:MAG: NAD(P)H-quinone oxidoreductase subunit 2, chloroplastic [Hyphomicrobiaceae bacterium hypho_1]